MNKRPFSVTIIGRLIVVAGAIGFVYHASEFSLHPFRSDVVLVCIVRLVAILSGVFLLRGRNWARWLLLIWIAYHVILSAFHSFSDVLIHSLLLVVIAYFLLRPRASSYFRSSFRGGRNVC